MRFGQGLIHSLINPSMGQNLFQVGAATGQTLAGVPQQMAAHEQDKTELAKRLSKIQQESVAATQLGDVAALGQHRKALSALAASTTSSVGLQAIQKQQEALQAMLPAAGKTRTANATKAVTNVDASLLSLEKQYKGLTGNDPESQAKRQQVDATMNALRERRTTMLQDPDVSAGYVAYKQARNKASADAYLKNAQVLTEQRKQQEDILLSYLSKGVSAENLKGKEGVDDSLLENAQLRYRKRQQELAKLDSGEIPDNVFKSLTEPQRAQLAALQATNSTKEDQVKLVRGFVAANIQRDETKRSEAHTKAWQSTVTTAVSNLINGKNSSWLSRGKNIVDHYDSIEGHDDKATAKLKEEFQQEAEDLFAESVNHSLTLNQDANTEEVLEEAFAFTVNRLAKRYNLKKAGGFTERNNPIEDTRPTSTASAEPTYAEVLQALQEEIRRAKENQNR